MAKTALLPPVLTQGELLSHGTARVTVTCGELSVSDINRFADFDFFGEHFRSDHFSVMLVTHGSVDVSVNLRPFEIKKNGLVVVAPNAIKQLVRCFTRCTGNGSPFYNAFLKSGRLAKTLK